MKYFRAVLCVILGVPLSISTAVQAQSWTNILSTSRAINWSNAGLPAALPDGETTADPWSPPVRTTQCGSTLTPSGSASTDTANINNALKSCSAKGFVLLGAGTFQINGEISMASNVSLRGSGGSATALSLIGSAFINYGICCYSVGYGALSANPSAGATSVPLSGVTGGTAPSVGNLAWFNQCDTGYSGTLNNGSGQNTCTTGSHEDNGGVYICFYDPVCMVHTSGSGPNNGQVQVVRITSVTNNGGGKYTIGFSPGLYMPNWSTSNTAGLYWQSPSAIITGAGLEDMTVEVSFGASENIDMADAYASWIKGVRFIGAPADDLIVIGAHSKNDLVANNYAYAQNAPSNFTSGSQIAFVNYEDSDNLFINNICDAADCMQGEGADEGDIYAYNYGRDTQNNYNQATEFQHNSTGTAAFILVEGNEFNSALDDDTFGSHDFDTWFRNHLACWNPPYAITPSTSVGIEMDSYARFDNAVGNAIGTTGTSYCATTQSTTNVDDDAFGFDSGNNDGLNFTSSMRWGNYLADISAARWCGNSSSPGWSTTCNSTSEVPTTLSGNAAPYENPVPTTTDLPCSFFMPGYTSTTCAAHADGGTGISFWKVVTSWSSFPAAPSATQTQPFPPTGPDVSGGPYLAGHAYDVPAEVAWLNLPVDPSFQGSYSITSSSWSSGTETLTVSGLPNTNVHLMGAFQLSGVNAACTSGATVNNNHEILMTGSSGATISYALASNPGASCTGTLRWPDVREFDERVYEADSNSTGELEAPSGLTGSVAAQP